MLMAKMPLCTKACFQMESDVFLAALLDVAVPPAEGKQPQLTPEKPCERLLTVTKLTLHFHLTVGLVAVLWEMLDRKLKFMILLLKAILELMRLLSCWMLLRR